MIPAVLLVVMATITMYLFAGQFASYVVTSEINSQLRSMQAANAAVSSELAGRLERGEAPAAASIASLKKRDRSWGRRRVCAWHGTRLLPLDSSVQSDSVSYPDFFNKEDNEYAKAVQQGLPFKEIVRDNGQLYLRATSAFKMCIRDSFCSGHKAPGNSASERGALGKTSQRWIFRKSNKEGS